MSPFLLPGLSALAKIWSGIVGYRGAKRQSKNQITAASISDILIRSNIFVEVAGLEKPAKVEKPEEAKEEKK